MINPRPLTLILLLLIVPAQGFGAPSHEREFLQRLQAEVLLRPVDGALAALERVETALVRYAGDGDPASLSEARDAFADLVWHWKAAQAVYVAGVLNDDFVDHPRIIDHFHQGKESLPELLEAVLKSDGDLNQAMFKTSTRGIDALEYLLFAGDAGDQSRRRQAALLAVAHIEGWLSEIDEFYRYGTAFADGGEASLEMIVYALVDSSYRLAAWRLGEPGGLVDKYEGRPSAGRLEYFQSGLSMHAVESILRAHARFFAIGVESGYFTEQGRDKGLAVISDVRQKIDEALVIAARLAAAPETSVNSSDYRELYRLAGIVYRTYYYLLVDALGFEGKIVDADGD